MRWLVALTSAVLAASSVVARAQTSNTVTPTPGPAVETTQALPPVSAWVVSETTSPVDYSPLVAAATRALTSVKDAPTAMTIRCRGKRTELWIHADGPWPVTRANLLRIESRIDAQPPVQTTWVVSSDRRAALFNGDAVRFLRAMPDRAKLDLSVVDATGTPHQATFDLTGMSVIRRKIGDACQWEPGREALPERR